MTENNKQLIGWFSYRTVVLILAKKSHKQLRPNSKSWICQRLESLLHVQFSMERLYMYLLDHRCVITYKNIYGKVRSDIKLI